MRIRHKTTLHELNVPERALPFYPDYEPVQSEAPAEEKPTPGRKPEVTKDTK